MGYALSVTVDQPFETTVQATRAALDTQGFGVLTEIDLQSTLKSKINADIAPQVILGACRPPLVLEALEVETSIGLLLPCNVVVRAIDGNQTIVEALDPTVMVALTGNDSLGHVAEDARTRLAAALHSLTDSQYSPT